MYIKLTLIASLTATVFGAAGTPIWYGFGSLGLSEKDYVQIGQYSAVALVVSAYLLLPLIFASIVPSKFIKSNILFTVLAISGAMLPMLGISFFSYEFPPLIDWWDRWFGCYSYSHSVQSWSKVDRSGRIVSLQW